MKIHTLKLIVATRDNISEERVAEAFKDVLGHDVPADDLFGQIGLANFDIRPVKTRQILPGFPDPDDEAEDEELDAWLDLSIQFIKEEVEADG